jgi:syntaxin 1B/2/3
MAERPDAHLQMATMVAEQEPALVNVEAKAVEAETNMNQACVVLRLRSYKSNSKPSEGQMQKAVKSARQARRKRWICFIVLLVILIAVGIGLAVHFTQQNRN